MAGAFVAIIFCVASAFCGRLISRRCVSEFDPALAWGLSGLLGLLIAGWATFLVGMLPGGLTFLWIIPVLIVIGALAGTRRAMPPLHISIPRGGEALAAVLTLIAIAVAFAAVFGPSDMNDWDSLAYHLAVPKIWLAEGQITFIPFIHQSNFPFAIDNLYLFGLAMGSEAGAKMISVGILVFSVLAIFGFARSQWGATAGWWAALAWVGIPVVLWESGTAYIDAGHGAYAGIGLLFLGKLVVEPERRENLFWCAVGLAGAASTKYTGLQVLAAAMIVGAIALFALRRSSALPKLGLAGVVAIVAVSPWLSRNAANTGNPLYPFFHEVFQGRNWDSFMTKIYKNEQQSFGVGQSPTGGRQLAAFGHAALGLAYQPGRYVNPGQTAGLGSPTGALGFVVVAAGLIAAARKKTVEIAVPLGCVLLLLVMWFFLSQQSRYLTIIGFPLAALAGWLAAGKLGSAVKGAIAIQSLVSIFWVVQTSIVPKAPVLTGQKSVPDYRKQSIGAFAYAAEHINSLPKETKVALFDEVFGFLLDRPYIWANPGHSKLIAYENIRTPEQLIDGLTAIGVTHVYLSLRFQPREERLKWLATAGMSDQLAEGYSQEEAGNLLNNREAAWKLLLAQAHRNGLIVPVFNHGTSGFLFEIKN